MWLFVMCVSVSSRVVHLGRCCVCPCVFRYVTCVSHTFMYSMCVYVSERITCVTVFVICVYQCVMYLCTFVCDLCSSCVSVIFVLCVSVST